MHYGKSCLITVWVIGLLDYNRVSVSQWPMGPLASSSKTKLCQLGLSSVQFSSVQLRRSVRALTYSRQCRARTRLSSSKFKSHRPILLNSPIDLYVFDWLSQVTAANACTRIRTSFWQSSYWHGCRPSVRPSVTDVLRLNFKLCVRNLDMPNFSHLVKG